MGEPGTPTERRQSLPGPAGCGLPEVLDQDPERSDAPAVRSAWLVEIQRRDAQIRSSEKVTRPAEVVLKEARDQLRCMTQSTTTTQTRR